MDWPATKKGDFVDGTHQNGLAGHKKGRFRGRDTSKWTGRPQKKGDFVDGKPTEYGKDYNKGQGTDDGGDQDTDF